MNRLRLFPPQSTVGGNDKTGDTMSKISTTGPSYKAGYEAGYAAALEVARQAWRERMAQLRADGLLRELATIDS